MNKFEYLCELIAEVEKKVLLKKLSVKKGVNNTTNKT